MSIRVYAVAYEFQIDSRELVELLSRAGISGKGSALASLNDNEYQTLKDYFEREGLPYGRLKAAGENVGDTAAFDPWSHEPLRVESQGPDLTDDLFVVELMGDLLAARKLNDSHDCGFGRRTYVQTLARTLEGVLAALAESSGRGWFHDSNPSHPDTIGEVLYAYAESKARECYSFELPRRHAIYVVRAARNRIAHARYDAGIDVTAYEINAVREIDEWLVGIVNTFGIANEECVPTTEKDDDSESVVKFPTAGTVMHSFAELHQFLRTRNPPVEG